LEPVEVKNGTPKIDLALEYAREHAMGEADLLALQRLFWRIWADPDLIAFPLLAASLREIGGLAQKMWNEQLDAFGVERWSSLSVWLEQHLSSIVSEIKVTGTGNHKTILEAVNCPILEGHLNNLTNRRGTYAELSLDLVKILDDVEVIAGLIDHKFPAERRALSRASHIAEYASQTSHACGCDWERGNTLNATDEFDL
jgi:hypothetical protein